MYAVVKSGGKQYKVEEGQILRIEKIAGDVGSPVKFDQVLLIADGEDIQVGQPVLDDASVGGHIVEQGKARKIIVFKYKRRKGYRRKHGHRQQYTAVQIDTIHAKATRARKKAEPAAKAKKPEAGASAAEKPETKKASAKETPATKAKPTKADSKKPAAKKTATQKTSTKKTVTPKTETQKEDKA